MRDARRDTLTAPPYAITDLTPIAAKAISQGRSDGFGIPTAVNDAGHITYYDECGCAGENNIALVIDDNGSYAANLYENDDPYMLDSAIPYAISKNDDAAGSDEATYGEFDTFFSAIAWSGASVLYESGADQTVALSINDAGVSVGNDSGARGSNAAAFSLNARGAVQRTLLLPPKNTSWVGTATGINDAGEIVGYATFGTNDARAVLFYATGNARVLPVGAPGVSSSAQAINQHGDIVGNAGSQAFLYRYNRVSYLPRPAGDEAGNAVGLAVNQSDQVVGNIITNAGTMKAFLYSGGQAYDLDALLPANSGWQIESASGINDAGQIVGVGYYAGEGGALTAFSMKPQAPPPRAGSVVIYTKGISGTPQDITRGPDGNMWFTEIVGGSLWIAKTTHDGVVTEYAKGLVHAPSGGIASGSDGNLWFANGNEIGKITTSGAVTQYTAGISRDADPSSLVEGPDGNVWFVEPLLDRIGKITPAGVVTEYSKGLPYSDGELGPTAITSGPGGNLWFIATGSPGSGGTPADSIGKITPAGAVTLYPYPGALTYLIPTRITNGPDGNIWVVAYSLLTPPKSAVGKVTPNGVVTEFPASAIQNDERFFGLTSGPGGVWYTQYFDNFPAQISKMTPTGVVTSYPQGLAVPNRITDGADGYLWFTMYSRGLGKIKS